jgi:hypothetical protein
MGEAYTMIQHTGLKLNHTLCSLPNGIINYDNFIKISCP